MTPEPRIEERERTSLARRLLRMAAYRDVAMVMHEHSTGALSKMLRKAASALQPDAGSQGGKPVGCKALQGNEPDPSQSGYPACDCVPSSPSPDVMAELRGLLEKAARHAAFPLERIAEKSDGSYGGGPNPLEGYFAPVIVDSKDRRLFFSDGSDVALIEDEYDEDGRHAWDAASYDLADLFIAAVNALPALLNRNEELERETGRPEVQDALAHIRGTTEAGDTYEYEHGSGWRCFHCGEIFRTPGGARLHFGTRPNATTACAASTTEAELAEARGAVRIAYDAMSKAIRLGQTDVQDIARGDKPSPEVLAIKSAVFNALDIPLANVGNAVRAAALPAPGEKP